MKESFILENLMLFIRYRILFENVQNILFQSSYLLTNKKGVNVNISTSILKAP